MPTSLRIWSSKDVKSWQKKRRFLMPILNTLPFRAKAGDGRQYPGRRFALPWAMRRLPLRGVPNRIPSQQTTTWVVTRNVKSKLFRAKKFNIFYIFGREKNPISSIRAPIKPRKFPIKPVENPQKHLEFSTSDVFLPLYRPKKEEKAPCLGLSPLR